MNKTKAKGLIKKLNQAHGILHDVDVELTKIKFEHLLRYAYDDIEITIDDLKEMYHIK